MRLAHLPLACCALTAAMIFAPSIQANDALPPVSQRYSDAEADESPSFQRHVVPLFGRLGCNGRACHGSFQGRGGFQLSLFGYDFAADHKALHDDESPRVDPKEPLASLIIHKPTNEDEHEGGQRYKKDGWEYRLIKKWIEQGAKYPGKAEKLVRLQIEPSELIFNKADQKQQLRVVAVWKDGTREDVTPLCRFQSNNKENATVDRDGQVVAKKPGDTHVVVFYDNAVVPVPVLQPVSNKTGKNYPKIATANRVDELVIGKLRKLGVVPSEVCSDAEFLRRARLDLTGTLPTRAEVEQFLADKSSDKRAKKIDQLLETPEYAAWWTTKLCDFTGNNSQQLNNIIPGNDRRKAGQDWYDWIHKRVKENMPYDKLAEGVVTAVSRKKGQSYQEYCKEMTDVFLSDSKKSYADLDSLTYYWARRNFRQPPERAIAFAYAFMGVRIQCAQCHKHPFDQWSKDDFTQFTNFFSGVQYAQNGRDRNEYNKMIEKLGLKGLKGGALRKKLGEVAKAGKVVPFGELYVGQPRNNNRNRKKKGKNNKPPMRKGRLLGQADINLAEFEDPRQPLMEWLRSADNRFFAPSFVNRVWSGYFHTGIVEPADDLSLANPPSNKPLLDYLAQGFIKSGFDMKWVHRTILNSHTYQRSWKPNETNKQDYRNFSRVIPRRLPAEVLVDAVKQATLADARVAELQKDITSRAICTPSVDNRGGRNNSNYALTIFGRSTRESNCDCDRSVTPSLLQTVYLQNDNDVLSMISGVRDDGWVEQISAEYGLVKAPVSATANLQRQVASLKKRLGALQKAKNKAQIKRVRQQLAQVQKRLAKAEGGKQGKAKIKVEPKPFDAKAIVNSAYLRTLSRPPNEKELDRSVAYLTEAENKVNGVRDLLWALVNTKEFIVNH